MELNLRSSDAAKSGTQCLIIGVLDGKKLLPTTRQIDDAAKGALTAILKSGDLGDKPGATLLLQAQSGVRADRVLLVRLGAAGKLTGPVFANAVRSALRAAATTGARDALITLAEASVKDTDPAWRARRITFEAGNLEYRFTEFKSKKGKAPNLRKLGIQLPAGASRSRLKVAVEQGQALQSGVATARRLGDLPPNVCTPRYLATQARALATRHETVRTRILGEREMKRLGMHSLLSVSNGSAREAQLIIMEYQGGKKGQKPEVLVGKGITFDTGGISLKPGAAMDEMKYDMCGAAAVFGTMTTCAELGIPLNIIGVVAAAENMPSGTATCPGDIVKTMSGQTVEILNTDAEGRLVLCDTLTYVERFKPAHVIDVATLTGACVVALGKVQSGLFSQDDNLADRLLKAGQTALDPTWRMPLQDEYQSLLDSNFADMANIGGPHGGAITAACFLARYTKAYSWAHLDIAGVAWLSGGEKGATGRPVSLLTEYLLSRAETAAK